ncbi:hypothetical protein HID58_043686, partial [Brassica napus]
DCGNGEICERSSIRLSNISNKCSEDDHTVNTWAGFVSMLPLFSAPLLMRIVIDSSLPLLLILSTLLYESFTLNYIHICV